jgi:hypothetical protein
MPARFRHISVRLIAAAALLVAQTLTVAAQGTVTPDGSTPAQPSVGRDQVAPIFSQSELAQLLAPIALYPDQLVTEILMAAGYPLEVVEANRWLRDPQHAVLTGDALASALQPIDWDPSVKSLVPYPQILGMMEERLDWTRKLGAAFIAQQADVMDAVQRLRYAAWDTGNLRSSDRLTVTPLDGTITITPAAPDIVYIPVYNPATVYGVWPYPAYPPVVLAMAPGYYAGPAWFGGIGFGAGYIIAHRYWDWQYCDWRRHRLVVDRARVNTINANFVARDRWRSAGNGWAHDPHHRRGLSVGGASAASVGGGAMHAPMAAPWRAAPTRVAPQLVQGNQSNALPPRIAISPPARVEHHDRGSAAPSGATQPPPVGAPVKSGQSEQPRRSRSTSAPAVGSAAPQFQGAPTTQFRNAPTTQFQNAPTTQFRNAPTTQFQNAPTTQFRNAPTTQFQNAPTTQFRNAPTTQFQNAPTTQFRNAPMTQFQNAPTQFRAAPSAPVPLAHVAPSSPAPLAHVAPSRPAPPAHVAPSQPAASPRGSSNGNGHGR